MPCNIVVKKVNSFIDEMKSIRDYEVEANGDKKLGENVLMNFMSKWIFGYMPMVFQAG